MTKDEAKKRVQDLRKLLNKYSYEYHVLDEPTVSDPIYDGLFGELKSIEAAFPDLIVADSPSQRVGGAPLKSFEKYAHARRMISLLDAFSDEEAIRWFERIKKLDSNVSETSFWVDSKKDGLACALHYEDGVLVRAVTRGDGTTGEVVTGNIKTIGTVPLRLHGSGPFLQGYTEVRGEIIMLKKDFDVLNVSREKQNLPVFANPRNLAAGTIRQLDPRLVAERKLKFHAYDLIRNDEAEVPTNTFAYKTLADIGFIVGREAHKESSIEGVLDYAHVFSEERHNLGFNTDGLVIKIDDRALFDRLGTVGKNPRGAIAYKYPAEQATTIVKDIIISIGRTGAATPVAVFDPVVVAGTTVAHASLHNADEIARKDIRVGDTVVIYKAGDIIPQVEEVIMELRPENSRRFHYETELVKQFPDLEFIRPEGEAVYRLKGMTGPLILKRSLEHFASKGALDIDGLGEKNVSALVDAGLVRDLADIYSVTEEQLLELDRFAKLSAKKLVEAIADKNNPPLPRFLFGLGIRHVGAQTAVDLSLAFKRLDSLGTASYEDLQKIEGVGTIVAESIVLWFDEEENQALLSKFRKFGVWPQDVQSVGGPLTGKHFVVTGTLETMSREKAAEEIRSRGGTFQSSVAKDTDYLVAGANVGASKLKKAASYDTQVIDEAGFLEMLS